MKLIIQNNRIAATATNTYAGPDFFIEAPADFDMGRMADYRYDADTGLLFLAPDTRLTKLAFRNRFTMAEKVAMEIAFLDDPGAAIALRQQAAALRANLADIASASYIDLTQPDTRDGVLALESAGLLATGRAAAVLDSPVVDSERYKAA